MSKKLIYVVLLLLLVGFVEALETRDESLSTDSFTISKDSKTVQIEKYDEVSFTDSKTKDTTTLYDTTLRSDKTLIELTQVSKDTKPDIQVRQGVLKGSDIITISNITLEKATIILEKYNPYTRAKALYREDDGSDWGYWSNYTQNETHLTIYTEHFSEFTASFPDVDVFNDISENPYLLLSDYINNYDGVYSIRFYGFDLNSVSYKMSERTKQSGLIYEYYGSSSNADILRTGLTYQSNDFVLYIISEKSDNTFVDSYFEIYDGLNVQDTSNSFLIYHEASFEQPTTTTASITSIDENTVSVNYRVNWNDLAYLGFYRDYSYGTPRARVMYRIQGSGDPYASMPWVSVSGTSILTRIINFLQPDTTYDLYSEFEYNNPVTGNTESITSSTTQFTTISGLPEPTVETVPNPSKTDTTATIQGVADFDGYTGTVTGLLCYRETGIGSFLCDGGQTISEGTVFTREITGLTADTGYEYLASITWDSESDTGSVQSFTTNAVAGESDLLTGLVSYYKLDETSDITAEDIHGTNDGTANNARVFTSEITGILNTGADFSGGDDKISLPYSDYASDTTGTINLWVKPLSDNGNQQIFLSLSKTSAGTELFIAADFRNDEKRFYVSLVKDAVNQFIIRTPLNSINTLVNTWVMFTLVQDGTEIKIYINGEETGVIESETDKTAWLKDIITDATSPITTFSMGYLDREAVALPFEGYTDELLISSKALSSDEVAELYNSGNALSYDDFIAEETTPSITTLSVQDIDTFSATFRSLPLSNDFTGDLFIQYQYALAEDVNITEAQEFWNWSSIPTTVGVYSDGLEAFNNTIDTTDTSIFTTLRPNSLYYVRANVLWNESIFYGESVNFTTLLPEFPVLETETALQIGHESMVARGKLESLGDFDSIDVAIFFDSNELYSATMTVPDTVGQTAFFLDENTTYCYYFIGTVSWTDDNGFNAQSQQGDTLCYTTVFEGDPILNTLPATNIKRVSAQLNYELFDMGIHDEFDTFFRYTGYDVRRDSDNFYIVDGSTYVHEFLIDDGSENLEAKVVYDGVLYSGVIPEECFEESVVSITYSSGMYSSIACKQGENYFGKTVISESDSVPILDVDLVEEVYITNDVVLETFPFADISTFISKGIIVEDLYMNTTYDYEVIALINGREVSGGVLDFTTLSLLDFLPPSLLLSVPDVGFEDITVNVFVELEDVNVSTLYFYLYDSAQELLTLKTQVVNESGLYSMNFDELESQRLYYYDVGLRYLDPQDDTLKDITTELGATNTLDIFETPTTVCIIDRFCLDVQDRYLFMLLFIVGISVLGLGFAVGNNLSNGNGAEKILIAGITGLSIVGVLWMYSVQLMPGWIFIYVILGNVLIGIYYVLQAVNGGSVYG